MSCPADPSLARTTLVSTGLMDPVSLKAKLGDVLVLVLVLPHPQPKLLLTAVKASSKRACQATCSLALSVNKRMKEQSPREHKTEWLCLNCQTKRLLEGSLGEPTPRPPPTSQQPPVGAPHRASGTSPLKQKGPQGLAQPSGPLPAKASPLPTKASPLPTKASPLPTKASPQAKPLRASEPSKTPSNALEKKTGVPTKAEPMPKPPPETTPTPGTPKVKSGVRRAEPATPVIKAIPEAPKGGEVEVSPTHFPGTLAFRQDSLWKGLPPGWLSCRPRTGALGPHRRKGTPQQKESLDEVLAVLKTVSLRLCMAPC
ncbi:hypothetical protein P7K49_030420 [Saguinus oedipus]|uniref:Uncharacterized protein n=1 Tax=Saguinus oedipus TaxID=9490 RepID=A0ABQ9U299_SAGOE|nr:hypothetical protein P7K49_030420 [Saguinus oedipus]